MQRETRHPARETKDFRLGRLGSHRLIDPALPHLHQNVGRRLPGPPHLHRVDADAVAQGDCLLLGTRAGRPVVGEPDQGRKGAAASAADVEYGEGLRVRTLEEDRVAVAQRDCPPPALPARFRRGSIAAIVPAEEHRGDDR